MEMKPFNIDVMIVVPGAFDSGLKLDFAPGTDIPDYEDARAKIRLGLMLRDQAANPGNPVKGMDVVVDVVRGEGCAAGRQGIPLWLALGDDAQAHIREKLNLMRSTIDEWEAVGAKIVFVSSATRIVKVSPGVSWITYSTMAHLASAACALCFFA